MIKGCRKRMVIFSELNDSSIEAAYFVMKEGSENGDFSENDIIKKANSLIEGGDGSTLCFSKSKRQYLRNSEKGESVSPLFSFLSGFMLGGIFVAVAAAMIYLL